MTLAPVNVLLVEDNPTDVALIQRQIEKINIPSKIDVLADLNAIDNRLIQSPPDLILCDYNLPSFDGLDVLELVQHRSPGTTFIFLTGTIEDEELAANTILSGASGYILKKNINELHERLKPHFESLVKRNPAIQPVRKKIAESRKLVEEIERFLENFSKENMSHREGMLKIQEDLRRLKTHYDFKTTEGEDGEPA